jgi:hypothetical protein
VLDVLRGWKSHANAGDVPLQNYLCETGSHNKRRNTLSDLHQVLDDMAKRLSVRTRRFPLLETGDP